MSWPTVISLSLLFALTLAFELGFILLVLGALDKKRNQAVSAPDNARPIDSQGSAKALADSPEETAPANPQPISIQPTQIINSEGIRELNEKPETQF